MSTKTKFIVFIVVVIIVIGGIGYFVSRDQIKKDSKLDGFAQCLKDSGAKFYGTFWCSHCQNQKKLFGSSAKYIPYIECANKDGSQNQICKDAGIEGYPTWIFADGTQLSGELQLSTLVEKTKCMLPE